MSGVVHISEAARQLGVSPQHLRMLEWQDRIPPARRDLNGRIYSEFDIALLRRIGVGTRPRRLRSIQEALLEHYAAMVPEGLDALSPEERHRVYKMLGLKVSVQPSGLLEVSGTFGEGLELSEGEPTRASGASTSGKPSRAPTCGALSKSASLCQDTRSSSTTTAPVRSGT
jgi:DNA-binding transcriptional MerR regulator